MKSKLLSWQNWISQLRALLPPSFPLISSLTLTRRDGFLTSHVLGRVQDFRLQCYNSHALKLFHIVLVLQQKLFKIPYLSALNGKLKLESQKLLEFSSNIAVFACFWRPCEFMLIIWGRNETWLDLTVVDVLNWKLSHQYSCCPTLLVTLWRVEFNEIFVWISEAIVQFYGLEWVFLFHFTKFWLLKVVTPSQLILFEYIHLKGQIFHYSQEVAFLRTSFQFPWNLLNRGRIPMKTVN